MIFGTKHWSCETKDMAQDFLRACGGYVKNDKPNNSGTVIVWCEWEMMLIDHFRNSLFASIVHQSVRCERACLMLSSAMPVLQREQL
jgi:hypothetical protein